MDNTNKICLHNKINYTIMNEATNKPLQSSRRIGSHCQKRMLVGDD